MKDVNLHIKNLQCSYDGENNVLECSDLEFLPGKIYFLLGKSGSGKSTFLESVGLMSNTSTNESEIDFEGENILRYWDGKPDDLADFRANNFSFIFQNTNLMPGYSAGQNMCFGSMVAGSSLMEAKPYVLEAMNNIELDHSLFDRNITHLSGGQRQRLAFVRAVTAKYNILFGDEPTGNLDELIADKLMTYLKKEIVENQKTAIIVSHNIDQAKKFADIIMCLNLNSEGAGSQLNSSTCFIKQDGLWSGLKDNRNVLSIQKSILELIN